MSAPLLNSIKQVEDRIKENEKFVLFYFCGQEQKENGGVKILKSFMQLTKQDRFMAAQWNSNKPEDADYLKQTYGISDKMGVILFRKQKFLTMVPDIRIDESKKLKHFANVLNEFDTLPAEPSPKEHHETIAKKADGGCGCCTIL